MTPSSGESIGLVALRIMRVFQANRSSTFVWPASHGTSSQSQIIWEIQSHLIWNLTLDQGKLTDERTLTVHRSLGWTQAQSAR
jgi:hypothetical protein